MLIYTCMLFSVYLVFGKNVDYVLVDMNNSSSQINHIIFAHDLVNDVNKTIIQLTQFELKNKKHFQ